MQLRVANIVPVTEAEGPGRRLALWLQGCPLRCPGCCNPEMLSFSGGTATTVDELLDMIESAADEHAIEGITLLGGEPFAHAAEASVLAEGARDRGLTVMIFSGFTLAELKQKQDQGVDRLLTATDLLVDGPFLQDKPDPSRRWIGSSNQQIHFLTDRYRAEEACWDQPDTLEIRMENGEVIVNGFPAKQAVGIWKRPRSRPVAKERSESGPEILPEHREVK